MAQFGIIQGEREVSKGRLKNAATREAEAPRICVPTLRPPLAPPDERAPEDLPEVQEPVLGQAEGEEIGGE